MAAAAAEEERARHALRVLQEKDAELSGLGHHANRLAAENRQLTEQCCAADARVAALEAACARLSATLASRTEAEVRSSPVARRIGRRLPAGGGAGGEDKSRGHCVAFDGGGGADVRACGAAAGIRGR